MAGATDFKTLALNYITAKPSEVAKVCMVVKEVEQEVFGGEKQEGYRVSCIDCSKRRMPSSRRLPPAPVIGDLSATIRGSAKASTALRNVTSGDNTHSSERGKSRSKTRAWVGQEMI